MSVANDSPPAPGEAFAGTPSPPDERAGYKFDAFISYRRSDGGIFARRLRRRLLDYRLPKSLREEPSAQPLSIYLDTIYEQATEDFFENTIKPALRDSRRLIVVQTPRTLEPRSNGKKNWQVREIEVFRELPQGSNVSVALVQGDFNTPLPAALREDFPNIEVVDCRQSSLLFPWDGRDQLLTFLAQLHGIAPEKMPLLREEDARRRGRRGLALLAAASLLILLLSGLLVWAMRSRAEARSALANSDLRQAVGLAEKNQPAAALAYLARALRLNSQSMASRSLTFNLLLRKNWPLPIAVVHHVGAINSAEFSPDGLYVLTGSADKSARLWNARTGAAAFAPMLHQEAVSAALFSPDGHLILTAAGNQVHIWNAQTGSPVGHPMQHGKAVTTVRFSRDGHHILTAANRKAQIWSTEGLPIGRPMRHRAAILTADIHPDGWRVVTAANDDRVRIWDSRTGRIFGAPKSHEDVVRTAAFSPDGRRLITASEDFTVRVWDVETDRPAIKELHFATLVRSAQFSPDGSLFLTIPSASPNFPDAGAQLWDSRTGQMVGASMSIGEGLSARFSADGRRVLTATSYGDASLWDAATGQRIGEPMTHTARAASARFSPEGRRVVTIAGNAAWVWDVQTGSAASLPLQIENAGSADFSPDGKYVVVAASPNRITRLPDKILVESLSVASVFSSETGRTVGAALMPQNPGWLAARFSSDGKLVLTVEPGAAHVWDALTSKPQGEPFSDSDPSLNQFSPDGRRWVARSGGTATVWDLGMRKPLGTPIRQEGEIAETRFSQDGARILTTSKQGMSRVWDAVTHKQIGKTIASAVFGSGWSRDGRWIVAAPSDRVLQMWDVDQSQPVGEPMRGVLGPPIFSPDHRRLLTGSDTAQVWDAKSGLSIGEPLPQRGLAFSADGERVVTAGDGTVQLWDVSTGFRVTDVMPTDLHNPVARLSPNGERLITGGGPMTQIWDVPVGQPEDAEGLADLAEAAGGLTLTNLGTLVPLPDRETRLLKLRGQAAQIDQSGSTLSRILKWFFDDRSFRTISPLSPLSVPEYIRESLAASPDTLHIEAARKFPDHPLLSGIIGSLCCEICAANRNTCHGSCPDSDLVRCPSNCNETYENCIAGCTGGCS